MTRTTSISLDSANTKEERAALRPRVLVVFIAIATSALFYLSKPATALEMSPPSEIGLSSSRLNAITTMLQREVEQRRISGAVAAIARHGRLGYFEAVGMRDAETASPMERDTIFRIASMTKTITSAGIMMLRQEGAIGLDDPISKFLPEFKRLRVLKDGGESNVIETVAADREPTIHDLLVHTSGFTYGWFGPQKLDAIYQSKNIPDLFVPVRETIADRVKRIAAVPLKAQPGSSWDYGVSTDILGRVIEVVSGLTLEQFFRERFFRPLRMHDTHFYLPRKKWPRLAALYTPNDRNQINRVTSQAVTADFLTFSSDYCLEGKGRFFSGGGGLVSSTTDYARFLQMLLGGGQLEGIRVLRRDTVARMTENQIGDMRIPFSGHGDGFGYGFGVLTDRGNSLDVASVGSFSWGGIFNTYFWVDPREQLIGILMTQLFPSGHLDLRERFKRLAYQAVDDSGFERVYWYRPGIDHANPHFNKRQLRVNAPEASIHPRFASRSESRSSGMARIRIDEDLREIRRAELYSEIWGGHPGTAAKRVSINGRALFEFPEVGSANHHCTHQYHSFNLRPMDLVNGFNSLQFACEQGDAFWGHYIVDNSAIRIGLNRRDKRLVQAKLADMDVTVRATRRGDGFRLQLQGRSRRLAKISRVYYQGNYFGFDENGNTWNTDWHGMTKERRPYGMLGSSTEPPFRVDWDTRLLPAQKQVAVRAFVQFNRLPGVSYTTPTLSGLTIDKPESQRVTFHYAADLPPRFWSRANNRQQCTIDLDFNPLDIVAAELHVVTWTGGAGDVENYFTLNGSHFPVAEGTGHETVYSRLPVDPELLQRGKNTITLLSDTDHHGIEVMKPGPMLAVRRRVSGKVRLTKSAIDPSAGDLDCYKIETPKSVFYLEKVGAGLSSMIDRDGNDWLSFHPEHGSGAGGEYRGFPNAVFREAGSYFHPRNAGTDPCVTMVEHASADCVVISALSSNGLWAGRYEFTDDGCVFTLTKKPADRKYWVLYEGTPGGQYDDSDWWMTSGDKEKHDLLTKHQADIEGPEWIAFGDEKLDRMLILSHFEDDTHTDRFYQMQKKMTVFGFGRDGMKKHLDSVPQSFAIGLVETTDHAAAGRWVSNITERWRDQIRRTAHTKDDRTSKSLRRRALEQFALTGNGDADAGEKLFTDDQRTKCSTCHRINSQGGEVGPDLSKIGNKFDRPHLIESLLEPSRQIVEGYRTSLVVTKDGAVNSGVIESRDDQSITLLDSENRRHQIKVSDVGELVETSVSIMPVGLADTLSPQEFTDLVSYLETLRTGKSNFGSGVSGPIQIPDGFEITTVATGLTGATAMETLPDGRVFVCEQPGSLRVIKHGKLLPDPFLTVPVENYWERGLIGVTIAPDFPREPYVYVVYVANDPYPHHHISRFRADGDVAVAQSEEVLLRGDNQRKMGGNVPAGHQGGAIHFGPDGKVYVAIGEQTSKQPAQQLNTFLGKILRLSPDGSIPEDNPFVDRTSGKYKAIWAIGCRNPFTFAFQKSTGRMFINDVGGKYEEINVGAAGANYGWPTIDHGAPHADGYTGPIHIYPQASIAGGDFADADLPWPKEYRGRYFFADFVHGWIKTIDPNSPRKAVDFASGIRRLCDLRFSHDGSLYVLVRNAWVVDDKFETGTGALLRIRPKGL